MHITDHTLEQRFWDKLKVGNSGECWEWQAALDDKGYGQIWSKGTAQSAHRVAWEIMIGPIPKDMNVLHRCDNRKCCNPRHLFLGSQWDNIVDMIRKGRGNPPVGINHPNSIFTEEEARDIKFSSLSTKELAEKYGKGLPTIINIRNGRRWKHLKPPTEETTNV